MNGHRDVYVVTRPFLVSLTQQVSGMVSVRSSIEERGQDLSVKHGMRGKLPFAGHLYVPCGRWHWTNSSPVHVPASR